MELALEAEESLEAALEALAAEESELCSALLLLDESEGTREDALVVSAGLLALLEGEDSPPQDVRAKAAKALRIRIDLRFFISYPF